MAETLISSKNNNNNNNVKFLCSYGGKIVPRRSDGRLRYSGGLTRVVSVPENISFTDLMAKLEELCGYSVKLRCQLPSEDLDVLVSIKSDEDLSNVIEEYHKASSIAGKELKIRAILSSPNTSPSSSPPYTSSNSSSSSADLPPARTDQCNPPAMRNFPAKFPAKTAQFNPVPYFYNRNNYYYTACRAQASARHVPSSCFSNNPYYWH